VLWQLAVTGYEHMHYAVLIGGNDYHQGVVRAGDHRRLADDIVAAVERFWVDHVAAGVPPSDRGAPEAAERLYKRLHPTRDGVSEADQLDVLAALDGYETARLRESAAKKEKTAAKAELLRLLGPAREAHIGGERAFSMEPTAGRASVDLERLAEEWPDAYAACVTTNPGERLSIARIYQQKGA